MIESQPRERVGAPAFGMTRAVVGRDREVFRRAPYDRVGAVQRGRADADRLRTVETTPRDLPRVAAQSLGGRGQVSWW
jgi:hypothetical protein